MSGGSEQGSNYMNVISTFFEPAIDFKQGNCCCPIINKVPQDVFCFKRAPWEMESLFQNVQNMK